MEWTRAELAELGRLHGERYRSAQPFPHIVLDDFFAPEALALVHDEFPRLDAAGGHIKRYDDPNQLKLASSGEAQFGPHTRAFMHFLNSLPFLTFLFLIMETAIVFFAQQVLETAVSDSARLIMTGQAQTAKFTQDSFKTAVCARVKALFDCTGSMYVDVRTYTSFSGITSTVPLDANGKPVTTYQPGQPSDIVVVRLMYQWPITAPLVRMYLADASASTRLLVATAAFRNEPY